MSARVLVVDDIAINVRLLEAKLSAEYYDVITADSGQEALRMIKTEEPDIVLLDVMMPEMDGFEVCERIKADPETRHIPVIMVTALNEQRDRVRGLEAGADDFLTKPVNDTALFARLKSLLRVKMLLDELRLREETSRQLGALSDGTTDEELLTGIEVLAVDDNPTTIDVMQSVLGEENHLTIEAPDAAVEAACRRDLDLILINFDLSSGDPLRLCSQLRSQDATRHCAILVLVGEDDIDRLAKALELGANDYVVKPVDRSELRVRVRTQLRYKHYHDQLRGAYRESVAMALTDSLTGLYNRRYVTSHLANMNRTDVALLMIDIDHFKAINDQHGHDAGDLVLCEVARRLERATRGRDLPARLGGEEFLVVVSDADQERAQIIAERLRRAVAGEPIEVAKGHWVTVTVSVGVALRDSPEEPSEDQLKRADQALYDAKRGGRDCVVMAA